ncbi:F-box protein SNE-like [Chenopodium quinoa]|uniref:F-box protein SNE-like n=1 Tax=Chenopodium quinoa TaxID=63459 RepID=UPI000B79357C|nr:F-box protein SNE-like [Chenopodium quinoa]
MKMKMFNRSDTMTMNKKRRMTSEYSINDHPDILVEVLKRLDGRSLGVASCVCRLWCSISKSDDSVWEYVCFRHVSPPPRVRTLVLALGGYKRLYMVCVRPVLGRWGGRGRGGAELTRRVWSRQGAQLLLSLFCVDYYEKLGGGGAGGRRVGSDAVPSSLMFLCKPVNV